MADLKGKRIGIARGNIMDIELTATAPEGTIFQRYDDEASSNAALLAGQVDAIGIPDHTGGLLARQNPDKQLESKFVTRLSPYGVGIKRGDSDLLQWLTCCNGSTPSCFFTRTTAISLRSMRNGSARRSPTWRRSRSLR